MDRKTLARAGGQNQGAGETSCFNRLPFRNAKTDLRIRPVYVYSADHVKAHVFMCMPSQHPTSIQH